MSIGMTNPNPTHLFISYAAEDLALARWLAQKLAARGHPVWFDKMKLVHAAARNKDNLLE